jgi:hypothetical protein
MFWIYRGARRGISRLDQLILENLGTCGTLSGEPRDIVERRMRMSCEKCYGSDPKLYRFYYGSRRSGSGYVKFRDTMVGSMTVSLCDSCVKKYRIRLFLSAIGCLLGGAALFTVGSILGERTGVFAAGLNSGGWLPLVIGVALIAGGALFINGLIELPNLFYRQSRIGAKLGYKINADRLKAQGYNVYWTSNPQNKTR